MDLKHHRWTLLPALCLSLADDVYSLHLNSASPVHSGKGSVQYGMRELFFFLKKVCRQQAMPNHNLLPELGLSLHSSAHSLYGLRFAKQPAAIGSPNNNHHEQETPLPCPDDSCVRAGRQQNSGGQLYTLVLRHHCTQIPPLFSARGSKVSHPNFSFRLMLVGRLRIPRQMTMFNFY